MKMTRRFLAVLLVVVMIVCAVPVTLGAEIVGSGTDGSLTWTLDSGGMLTISGTGSMNNYSYTFYNGTPATSAPWGQYYGRIKTVVVGDSVTSIGDYAFYHCSSLTSVTIGDSVTCIGNSAFYLCSSLTSVTIGDSVTSIGDDAFYRCTNLTSVTIPDSVTSIGNYAFKDCNSLTRVTIPDSVTSIGKSAFCDCSSLTSVTIPNSVTSIGQGAFMDCSSLTSVTIPGSVTSIGDSVFCRCSSLTSLTIPGSVTDIGNSAFYKCQNLKNITIPNSVTSIGKEAFKKCSSLTSIFIPASVTKIKDDAFSECSSIVSYNVSSDNTAYSSDSYGCIYNKNKSVLIQYPIGNQRTSILIPSSVTKIGSYSFYGNKNLNSISLSTSLVSIGYSAFGRCSFATIAFPTSLESIESNAFIDCNELTIVNLPNNVIDVQGGAFCGCEKLTEINISSANQTYTSSNGVLYSKDKTKLIAVPAGKTYSKFIIPETVTEIYDAAFDFCKKINEVVIPDSVVKIGWNAFYGSAIKSVIIPSSVDEVAFSAFRDCLYLKTVTLSNGTKTIGESAFEGCETLEWIYMPNSITVVDIGAFRKCTNLKDIYYTGSQSEWNQVLIHLYNDSLRNATVHYNYVLNPMVFHTVTYNYSYNGGMSATQTTTTVTEGAAIDLTPTATKTGWTFVGWNTNPSATTALTSLTMGTSDITLYAIFKQNTNIYNLGEETYSFRNYSDSDSRGGHCFGMSSTSSMYYLGLLNTSAIGISGSDQLYTVSSNATVKKPICHYQAIQGSYSSRATVAGGCYYLNGYYDIASDWIAVVNYVKSHNYDDKGSLQIGFRKSNEGGHAINFLRYEVVDGQERIYAYDNNFPTVETYFYKDASGKVWQKPSATFSGSIDCIALRDVAKYYQIAGGFDATHVLYADEGSISIAGAEVYPMECGPEVREYYMYELPKDATQTRITPQADGSTFTYMGETYHFDEVDDDTYAVFTLENLDEGGSGSVATFTIYNAPSDTSEPQPSGCPWCGGEHVGFFAGIIGWFHGILARIFGARY